MWVFIFGDLTVFALLFGVFIVERSKNAAVFDTSQRLLNQNFGAVNTLLLLSSSLLVATGVRAIRQRLSIGPKLFVGAIACGAAFSCIKFVEWGEKLSAGHNPGSNHFFMYYFILTGLHFMHLVLGMCVLTFLFFQARRPERVVGQRLAFVEGGACFWHMVDLLWIVLFPLIYLMH